MCFVFIVPTFIAVSLVVSLLVDAFFPPHKNKVLESDTRAFYGRVVPSFRGATAERFWHRRRRRRRRRPFRRYRHLSRLDRRSRRCSREATFLFGRRRARSRAISRAPSRDDVRGLPRNVRALPRRVSRGVQITHVSRVVVVARGGSKDDDASSGRLEFHRRRRRIFWSTQNTKRRRYYADTRTRNVVLSSAGFDDRRPSRIARPTHAQERERERRVQMRSNATNDSRRGIGTSVGTIERLLRALSSIRLNFYCLSTVR